MAHPLLLILAIGAELESLRQRFLVQDLWRVPAAQECKCQSEWQ